MDKEKFVKVLQGFTNEYLNKEQRDFLKEAKFFLIHASFACIKPKKYIILQKNDSEKDHERL